MVDGLRRLTDRLVARFAPEVEADASQVCVPACYMRGACPVPGYEHCACNINRDCSGEFFC